MTKALIKRKKNRLARRGFYSLFDDIDRMFDRMWKRFEFPVITYSYPEVETKDGKATMKFDLAGFDKEDLDIEYDKGYLSIKAEKKDKGSYKSSSYCYKVDTKFDDIDAEFKEGKLTVEFPYEEAEVKRIEVK